MPYIYILLLLFFSFFPFCGVAHVGFKCS